MNQTKSSITNKSLSDQNSSYQCVYLRHANFTHKLSAPIKQRPVWHIIIHPSPLPCVSWVTKMIDVWWDEFFQAAYFPSREMCCYCCQPASYSPQEKTTDDAWMKCLSWNGGNNGSPYCISTAMLPLCFSVAQSVSQRTTVPLFLLVMQGDVAN